jgi:hypothetical protein
MCSADLSLYTFTWPPDLDPYNVTSLSFLDAHSKSPRQCRAWSQIEEFSQKRKISLTPNVIFSTDEGAHT